MAGIDKLRTSFYSDFTDLRIWIIRNKPSLLDSLYDPFISYMEFEVLQRKQSSKSTDYSELKLIIAVFTYREDKYLYWHCPLDFVREYLEKQCGFKKANWFVKLFWRN